MLPENVPVVEIVLDRPRKMALTLGAMRRIQEQTGQPVTELGELLKNNPLEHLGGLIWAALVNEDREGLKSEDIEEMLHLGNLEPAIAAYHDLLASLLPQKGAEGKGLAVVAPAPRKSAASSTSRRSGRSGATTSGSPTLSSGR